jgi:hypothetical protein
MNSHRILSLSRAAILIPILLAPSLGLGAGTKGEKLPPVWGYGVKTCTAFLAAVGGREAGDALQDLEYQRFQDWLTGFITGLNLSTGKDVLVGADINGALNRINAYCQGHGKEDVFTATMDLVRMLGRLK